MDTVPHVFPYQHERDNPNNKNRHNNLRTNNGRERASNPTDTYLRNEHLDVRTDGVHIPNTNTVAHTSLLESALRSGREKVSHPSNPDYSVIDSNGNVPFRAVVCGPTRSGKTSLAMDVAHSIATSAASSLSHDGRSFIRSTKTACHVCNNSLMANMDNEQTHPQFHDGNQPIHHKTCACCAVVFLVHERKRNIIFPMKCHKKTNNAAAANCANGIDAEMLFQMKMKELEDAHKKTLSTTSEFTPNNNNTCEVSSGQSEYDESSSWEDDALNRIHIKYLSGDRELIHYLSCIQALPQESRPKCGIIIDDLDGFIENEVSHAEDGEHHRSDEAVENVMLGSMATPCDPSRKTPEDRFAASKHMNTTTQAMKLVQILALLADTADFLEQQNNHDLTVIATIHSKHSSWILPHTQSSQSIISNWMPTIVTLNQYPPSSSLKTMSSHKKLKKANQTDEQQQNWYVNVEKDEEDYLQHCYNGGNYSSKTVATYGVRPGEFEGMYELDWSLAS